MFLLLSLSLNSFAQNNDERQAYLKTITERSAKIVQALNLANESKTEKVTLVIRDQYDNLNEIYKVRDAKIATAKSLENKAEKDTAIAVANRVAQAEVDKLHPKYLKNLGKHLSADQIDAVKNGMTYNVLPITYKAYQEQILTLTEVQKKQIWTWLVEAREHAMDAESSNKKHAWFGKYKGRINNYLSKEGYDLKKEGEEWEKRRKAASSK